MRSTAIFLTVVMLATLLMPGAWAASEQGPDGSAYEYEKHGSAHPDYYCEITRADTVGDVVSIPAVLEGYDVAVISEGAFSGCRMTCAVVPQTVAVISEGAFGDCPYLRDVYFLGDRPRMEGAFDGSARFHAMPGRLGWEDVETIPTATLGGIVYAMMPDCAMAVGGEPTDGTVTIEPVVEGAAVRRIGPYAFAGAMQPDGEVERRSDIREARISEGVETVGERAFYYSDIESVGFADSVGAIHDEAFRGCVLLGSLALDSVRSIGFEAFRDCAAIRQLVVPGSVERCGAGAFYLCMGMEAAEVSASAIPERMFGYCSGLERVTLHGTEAIGSCAFYRCDSLRALELEDVRAIGSEAFRDCASLEEAVLGRAETIGQAAFRGCVSLEAITMPDTVSYLGRYAFADCIGLKRIVSLGSAPAGDSTVFLNVEATVGCRPEHADSWISSDFGLDVACDGRSDRIAGWLLVISLLAVSAAAVMLIRKRSDE